MKKPISWPKPRGYPLDDDSGLLIGNRVHRVVGGQVIGQMGVQDDAVNTFGASDARTSTSHAPSRRWRRASSVQMMPLHPQQ